MSTPSERAAAACVAVCLVCYVVELGVRGSRARCSELAGRRTCGLSGLAHSHAAPRSGVVPAPDRWLPGRRRRSRRPHMRLPASRHRALSLQCRPLRIQRTACPKCAAPLRSMIRAGLDAVAHAAVSSCCFWLMVSHVTVRYGQGSGRSRGIDRPFQSPHGPPVGGLLFCRYAMKGAARKDSPACPRANCLRFTPTARRCTPTRGRAMRPAPSRRKPSRGNPEPIRSKSNCRGAAGLYRRPRTAAMP